MANFNNFHILFTTHSSYLTSQFLKKKDLAKSDLNLFKHSKENNIVDIERVNLNIFDNLNTRETEIVLSSLFDENVFLVEGLKEYEFVNKIMENDFKDFYFSVYDCGGKDIVKKSLIP